MHIFKRYLRLLLATLLSLSRTNDQLVRAAQAAVYTEKLLVLLGDLRTSFSRRGAVLSQRTIFASSWSKSAGERSSGTAFLASAASKVLDPRYFLKTVCGIISKHCIAAVQTLALLSRPDRGENRVVTSDDQRCGGQHTVH